MKDGTPSFQVLQPFKITKSHKNVLDKLIQDIELDSNYKQNQVITFLVFTSF